VLEVVEPGVLTSVQDAGRPAGARWGVPVGGACDRWSLAAANSLAGNREMAPALEMTLAGATLRASEDCLVGVAGAEMAGRVVETGALVASGSALVLRAGQTLALGPSEGGARAYVAVAGGVDVPQVLDSASTCLIGGFGGVDGRPLRTGDRLSPAQPGRLAGGTWRAAPVLLGSELRVVRGPHLDRLGEPAFEALVATDWTAGVRGDRQGIALDGPPIPVPPAPPLISQGMVWGAVQLPPDGRPICLLADHNTVGGYSVVAVVIRADLPLLGQLGPGDAVRFVEVSLDEARAALVRRRRALEAALTHSSRA
jgi:biotin-dependent carboxylase-like uncharacterized protein